MSFEAARKVVPAKVSMQALASAPNFVTRGAQEPAGAGSARAASAV